MDKITVELTREDALLLSDFLDGTNFYIVGAALCNRPDNTVVFEDVTSRHTLAVNHAWFALDKALRE